MTDNEIIKALECCKGEYDTNCTECPYSRYTITGCRTELRSNAFDLINRQKTEIEQYKAIICTDTEYIERIKVENRKQQAEIERLEDLNKCYYTSCQQTAKSNHEIKAEAVKEFEERAIKNICEKVYAPTPVQSCIVEKCNQVIIEIAKEMVGADNG